MAKQEQVAILPCNGLDKCAGCIAREAAIIYAESHGGTEIICPVLYRVSDARYKETLKDSAVIVIDGCATRCATKLAAEKGLKIKAKVNVTDEAKTAGLQLPDSLRLGEEEKSLAQKITQSFDKGDEAGAGGDESFIRNIEYETYRKDKFVFKFPKEGFFFNENDCWAMISGNKARIGVSDFIQKKLSDILFFEPPTIGTQIEQFGEAGSIESTKAVFEIVSPVSGRVTAINAKLLETPELVNQSPYEEGWIAELELTEFDSDRELLYDCNQYFEAAKKKVDEYHV